MNLYYIHFRKKDFDEKELPVRKHDVLHKKSSKNHKRGKNECDIHQLAIEHALAYFRKPWDHYLKEKSQASAPICESYLCEDIPRSINQKEANINSCLVYQKCKNRKNPNIISENLKQNNFSQNVLSCSFKEAFRLIEFSFFYPMQTNM